LREESLHIINQRFEKGIIPEIDVYQAQVQREIAAGAIPAFERQVVQTENTLSILLGRLPQTFDLHDAPDLFLNPPEIPAGLPAQLLERRPDIAEAEFRLRAQTARIGVAEAQRLPAISLTGTLGKATDDLSQLTTGELGWSVGGTIFGPIFNFNKNIRRVDIEEERARQALLLYEKTVLQAFREVEDALSEVQTFRTQLSAKRKELEASQGAAELSRSRYDRGFTSYLEVLESERSLFSVELQHSEVQAAYNNAYVRLYKALGGGWITRQEAEGSRGGS
jgi:multidrug efflux system outer membrane protein